MGCVASELSQGESPPIEGEVRDNEENIVCQICNVCFNTKERAPLIICPSNHSVCKTCADSFSKKSLNRCPFCRVELNFACLTNNERLMIKLGKYQSEEKGFVRKNPSFMSQQQLLRWTSEEAKKYNYLGVYEKVLSRHTKALNTYTRISEQKHKLNSPIDLTVFPNIDTLDFRTIFLTQLIIILRQLATLEIF